MKSNFFSCMKRFIAAGVLAAAFALAAPGYAIIVAPYTADANTLHLWHLNESAVPAIDAVANLPGTNCINLANGATLGTNSYSGFGTALNTIDGGQDNITGTARDAFLSPSSGTGQFIFADTTTKAFTFEAIVWIGFDPLKNLGTTANGGNNRNAPCQIMAIEGGAGARIFQFRISQVG